MDREKVIKGLKELSGFLFKEYGKVQAEKVSLYYDRFLTVDNAIALLKEQEPRELTMDEWREWKADSRRNPICMLWKKDTSPIWILNPNDVHEPALLMGKLKLFTGKPTFEQCKAVKWE